ncbi:MAG: PQQ-binding-like beta-propeller repeat protein [Anaerolineaceae bacterium]|jgi:outer membrane protein assembly factor BamB|nr:PQQ-binding-like beta-propeller repeat protein [Anaerolineaceae bacterium]
MNNKKTILIFLSILIVGLISGCASTVGSASSWPGITSEAETGYFAYGAEIYAIDTKNGSLIWRYPSEPNAKTQFFAAPAVSEDQVFAGSYNNTLVALDKSKGFEKWSFINAKDRYIASPLVVGDKVYAPNSDKYFYALNAGGDLLWAFKTTGPNWTKPVSDGQFVYLASMDHFLYAFNLEYPTTSLVIDKNGSRTLLEKPLWSVDLGAAVVADPVLTDGKVLVATIDGKLHNVYAASGKIAWTFTDGDQYNSIWGTPVVTADAVYLGNENGDLFAISPETGKALWAEPYAAGAPLIAGGIVTDNGVMFVSKQGKVFIIDAAKEPKPVVSLDTVMYSTPKLADGKILMAPANKEKLFMAIDLTGNEIWSFVPSK